MSRRWLPISTAESAGGVVLRHTAGTLEVLLVGSAGTWGLPKGTPLEGEGREETAIREVREETGLEVKIIEAIGSIRYWFFVSRGRVRKTVHYFLMTPTGGDISLHDGENERIAWFPAEEAMQIMSYGNEVEMVNKAVALFPPNSRQV